MSRRYKNSDRCVAPAERKTRVIAGEESATARTPLGDALSVQAGRVKTDRAAQFSEPSAMMGKRQLVKPITRHRQEEKKMPRFNVEADGEWACFSSIVDAFVTPFMQKED